MIFIYSNLKNSYIPSVSYSSLDSIICYSEIDSSFQKNCSYTFNDSFLEKKIYQFSSFPKKIYFQDSYISSVTKSYFPVFSPFLIPHKPVFVGDLSYLKEFVEDAFFKLTGKNFPDDIFISLLEEKDFIISLRSLGKTHFNGVLAFALNRRNSNMASDIVIKKSSFAQVMISLGHELGHVFSNKLDNDLNEEAKAFSFQLAWMKVLKDNNIANLSTAITLDVPASNGLHDVALDFVLKRVSLGDDAFDLFNLFSSGSISCN